MSLSMSATSLLGLKNAMARKIKKHASGYERGIGKATRYVLGMSKRIVPVRTGYLKSTAFWEVKGSGFDAVGHIGYSAEYAIYVHENVHHSFKKGKSAKFIEKPIEQNKAKIVEMIVEEMRKE